MKKVKIDHSNYPEEAKFQSLVEKFNLQRKAQAQRLQLSMEYVAKKRTFETIEDRKIQTKLNRYKNRDYMRE